MKDHLSAFEVSGASLVAASEQYDEVLSCLKNPAQGRRPGIINSTKALCWAIAILQAVYEPILCKATLLFKPLSSLFQKVCHGSHQFLSVQYTSG